MSDSEVREEFKLNKNLNLLSEFPPPSFEEWKAQVEKDLKGASYDKKLITKTSERIELNPIYTIDNLKDSKIINSFPGFEHFTRGNTAAGYHQKTWDVNQEIVCADADEFNSALHEAINGGQNCINLPLDSATKLGLDADYAKKEYVGDCGLSISGINSLKRVLDKIDLNRFSLYVDAGFNIVPILALINAHFENNSIIKTEMEGAVSCDPINYLAYHGEIPVRLSFIFDMLKNATEWTATELPRIRTIGITSLPYINSGANSVQELAGLLSTLVYYLDELTDRNIHPLTIINKTQFTLGISTNYFMEIAKLRAARVLISNIASEYSVDTGLMELSIGAKSSYFNQTKLDPYVNMLRSTTETFSAILGGANAITTSPFDETIRTPNSFSRRIARNTQTILREESHLDQVIDAAGGSFYIEKLTEELSQKAWDMFKKFEKEGGILKVLSEGIIQNSINETVNKKYLEINKRKQVIVGSNMFADIKEEKLFKKDFDQEAFKQKRSEYLKKFRLNGNSDKHKSVMEKLNAISKTNNSDIINITTEAYLNGSTIGEISSALYSSHKKITKIEKLKIRRASKNFELLRKKSDNYKTLNGTLPKVYLANYGSLSDYKARADFSKGFFESGGFEVIDPKGSNSIDKIITDAINSKAPAIVICSSDENYPEIVPPVAEGIKKTDINIQVILAGYPKEQIEQHVNSGVDDFIFLGADVMEKLSSLYNKIGGTE